MEQNEKLCDEVETVREFTYLGDWVSSDGGCVVAVTARTICGWVEIDEYGELLCDNWFPLLLKGVVFKNCAWLVI